MHIQRENVAYIMSKDLTKMLRMEAISMKLYAHRFLLSHISSHSLYSRGAIALQLGGMGIITIKKYG